MCHYKSIVHYFLESIVLFSFWFEFEPNRLALAPTADVYVIYFVI